MNVLDAVQSMGIKTKRMTRSAKRGVEYWSSCPACGGKDRFHVWSDEGVDGSYWCRQCGKTGDCVQFFVDFQGMTYPDAFRAAGREPLPESEWKNRNSKGLNGSGLSRVNKKSDIVNNLQSSLSFARSKKEMKMAKIEPVKEEYQPNYYDFPCESWQIKAQKLVDYAHEQLLKNPEQLKLLADRGIDIDAVRLFKLGSLAGEKEKPHIFRPRAQWGLPEVLHDNGKPKMLWIPRGLVIPFFQTDDKDQSQKIVRVRIRRPDADIIKKTDVRYYVLPGSSMDTFIIYPERDAFIVVESELDAIMLARQVGMFCGVAGMGSAQAKPDSSVFYEMKKAECVLVALDADEAGIKAANWWVEEFQNAKILKTITGKDAGEQYQAGVDCLEWVLNAVSYKIKSRFQQKIKPVMLNNTGKIDTADNKSNVDAITAQTDDIPSEISIIESRIDSLIDKSSPFPYSILKLKALLDVYPVKIQASKTQTRIISHPEFDNQSVTAILSQLVFWDAHVWDFLENHPAEYIDRTNFMAVYDECFA